MAINEKTKSDILTAVHSTASDFYKLGFIDKRKMRKFDALCLQPLPDYDSQKIRSLRENNNIQLKVLSPRQIISLF